MDAAWIKGHALAREQKSHCDWQSHLNRRRWRMGIVQWKEECWTENHNRCSLHPVVTFIKSCVIFATLSAIDILVLSDLSLEWVTPSWSGLSRGSSLKLWQTPQNTSSGALPHSSTKHQGFSSAQRSATKPLPLALLSNSCCWGVRMWGVDFPRDLFHSPSSKGF